MLVYESFCIYEVSEALIIIRLTGSSQLCMKVENPELSDSRASIFIFH